jgi:hypothetical protein
MAPSMKGVAVKLLLVILAAATVIGGAALAFFHDWSDAASSTLGTPPQNVMYGHIVTMTSKGSHYEIKFDPAWWLTGVAAERAALEDTGSSDVPNDYDIVEEGHRLLTFVVRPDAEVTVLTGAAARATITPGQLAEVVAGHPPKGVDVFEREAGFWIRIGEKYPNPAVTLDQQYQP